MPGVLCSQSNHLCGFLLNSLDTLWPVHRTTHSFSTSARGGCLLRIIQNNTGEFDRAVEEFVSTIRFIGVETFNTAGNSKSAPAG